MNIKYAIVKNEMPASSTEAKYLGRIIPNGVRNRSQMTALALKNEHFAEATFAAVIDAAVDITQELCAEGHDVDWGTVKFLSKMHGSLPYEDSSFGDGTASLTLDADATNVTRTILDTLEPVKVSAAEIDSLIKVSNVMDVATEAFGTVVGTGQFAVLGNGITLDGAGEYVKALDRKTFEVKGTATVVSVSKGQRAYCKFDPQLAGGDYTLEIATKGLIGESTPRIFRKPVTAIAVAVPKTLGFTELKFDGGPDDLNGHFKLTGTNLDALKKNGDGKQLVTVNDSTAGTTAADCVCTLNSDGTLSGQTGSANFAGDTCVVTGTVDPARTDVTQGTVTKTLVGV